MVRPTSATRTSVRTGSITRARRSPAVPAGPTPGATPARTAPAAGLTTVGPLTEPRPAGPPGHTIRRAPPADTTTRRATPEARLPAAPITMATSVSHADASPGLLSRGR